MKKIFALLLTIVTLCLYSCGGNGTSVENMTFDNIELNTIFENIKENSARGKEMYEGKCFEFGGLISIYSDSSFSIKSLQGETAECSLGNNKIKQQLLSLNNDDYVKVSGKIITTRYSSIVVEVYNIEKPQTFSYDGISFGMDIDEVRNIEKRKSITNGSLTNGEIPYIIEDSFVDEFGYHPDFIRYGFHSWKLSKITLSYSDVDGSFFNSVVTKLSTRYGAPANTKETTKYTKRFITDSVLITVYYYEDSNSAGIIYMYPAYYSLSNYLIK